MDKSSYKFKLNFTAITIMILHSHVNICEGFVGVWKTGGRVGQWYPEEQTGCVEDWREGGTRVPRRTNPPVQSGDFMTILNLYEVFIDFYLTSFVFFSFLKHLGIVLLKDLRKT